jgi:phosphoribosylglycinamide formyltransferase 2
VESWQPQPMSELALQRSQQIAQQVTTALAGDKPGRGIFGVELFVKGDQVWFSEVSPRPHDTGLVTLVTQGQSEFALHARAILGLPVDTSLSQPGASAVIYGQHDADAIRFEGIDQALAAPGTELRLFGKPQAYVKRRMGVALARQLDDAESIDEIRARARDVVAKVCPVF